MSLDQAASILMATMLFLSTAYFVLLLLAVLAANRRAADASRCSWCGGPLVPLLDGGHRYRGEAACNTCGRLHTGVPYAGVKRRGGHAGREAI